MTRPSLSVGCPIGRNKVDLFENERCLPIECGDPFHGLLHLQIQIQRCASWNFGPSKEVSFRMPPPEEA